MNVIWVRVVSTMMYNAWRLYTLSKISDEIQSITCYEKFQKDRIRVGGTFEDFLKCIYDSMCLPSSLFSSGIISSPDLTLGKIGGISNTIIKKRMLRSDWNEDKYMKFRLNKDENHVPVDLEDFSTKKARLDSGEKKRKPVKACKFCTVSIESTTSDNTVAIVKKNVFVGHCYKRTSKQCLKCKVPLCTTFTPYKNGRFANKTCFELFHSVKELKIDSTDKE